MDKLTVVDILEWFVLIARLMFLYVGIRYHAYTRLISASFVHTS